MRSVLLPRDAWPTTQKRVASKLPLSVVRPMGLTAAGGAERCRIEFGTDCCWRRLWIRRRASRGLLVNVDEVRIYDPVAGGAALVVIDVGSCVRAGGLQRPGDGRAAFGLWLQNPQGETCASLTRSRVARRCL